MAFSTPTISAKIPDHLPAGSFVTLLEPDGADYAEVVNYTVLQHPSYPNSMEYFNVGETSGIDLCLEFLIYFYFVLLQIDGFLFSSGQITVAKRLLKAKVKSDYAFLVRAKDSCNTTATATVSIQTQNMVSLEIL